MATRKVTKPKKCVNTVNTGKALNCGYTKVRVEPEQCVPITVIASMTDKTIQSVVTELLQFAIDNAVIDVNGERVPISNRQQGGTK
jgi:UDP-3-O-acyl-N-acetylglucosamine deacetylase